MIVPINQNQAVAEGLHVATLSHVEKLGDRNQSIYAGFAVKGNNSTITINRVYRPPYAKDSHFFQDMVKLMGWKGLKFDDLSELDTDLVLGTSCQARVTLMESGFYHIRIIKATRDAFAWMKASVGSRG